MWSANVGETSIGSVGQHLRLCMLLCLANKISGCLILGHVISETSWHGLLKRWPWSFGSDRQSLHIQCPQIVSSVALAAAFFLGGFPVTQQLSANPFNFGELSTTYQGYANRDIRVLKIVWNIERMGDEETAAITNGKRAKNSVCLTPSGSPWQHHTESLRIAAWDNDPWIKQNQTFSVSDWFQGWLSNCQVQGVLMFFPNPTLYPKSRAAKNVPASGLPLPSDLPLSAQAMGCCQKLFFAITCNNNRYQ